MKYELGDAARYTERPPRLNLSAHRHPRILGTAIVMISITITSSSSSSCGDDNGDDGNGHDNGDDGNGHDNDHVVMSLVMVIIMWW